MFYVGLDLGQRQDYSALAVVERRERGTRVAHLPWMERREDGEGTLVVRHLERMKLGTPYTQVVRRVVEVMRHGALGGPRRLVVDATGVGMPVVDMLRASRPGCEIAAVLITGGQGERFDGKVWHVPKLDLLARLQGLLEQKRLRISRRMRESGTLVRELTDMRSTRRASGRLRVGADGSGEHDDLALAVALAVWMGRKGKVGEQRRRLPGI
jgi:hypothetical protein